MSTLLIRGISQLVTCDDGDRILKGVDLFCEDGFIRQIGAHLDVSADEVIDGTLPNEKEALIAESERLHKKDTNPYEFDRKPGV